jgi:hypothetical protein
MNFLSKRRDSLVLFFLLVRLQEFPSPESQREDLRIEFSFIVVFNLTDGGMKEGRATKTKLLIIIFKMYTTNLFQYNDIVLIKLMFLF